MHEVECVLEPRDNSADGYFVRAPGIRYFSWVEEDPDTDFKPTASGLLEHFRTNNMGDFKTCFPPDPDQFKEEGRGIFILE